MPIYKVLPLPPTPSEGVGVFIQVTELELGCAHARVVAQLVVETGLCSASVLDIFHFV